jgi:hypothetical protein
MSHPCTRIFYSVQYKGNKNYQRVYPSEEMLHGAGGREHYWLEGEHGADVDPLPGSLQYMYSRYTTKIIYSGFLSFL